MIILTPYETRFLIPVSQKEWRVPSVHIPRNELGHEVNRVRFRVSGHLNDGFKYWEGWFDSRDDIDAFLWAVACGSLAREPELWRLPTPHWHPDIGEGLTYEFATVTSLNGTAGSNQTYTVPTDWNDRNNFVDAIGAGASGAARSASTGAAYLASGGGGGGWSRITNLSLTKGGSVTYRLGSGGTAIGPLTGSSSNGNSGGDTWFNATVFASSSVGAKGGINGTQGTTSQTGGAGGASGSGIGGSKNSGGRGGSATAATVGAGGGGAAGPNGAGNQGVDRGTDGGSNGGSGDAGSGGSAGSAGSNNGGDGTEYGSTGSGGGGGGNATGTLTITAGNGGNYGGGGGGCAAFASKTVTSGAGINGLVVTSYTPLLIAGNMAMIGM